MEQLFHALNQNKVIQVVEKTKRPTREIANRSYKAPPLGLEPRTY